MWISRNCLSITTNLFKIVIGIVPAYSPLIVASEWPSLSGSQPFFPEPTSLGISDLYGAKYVTTSMSGPY